MSLMKFVRIYPRNRIKLRNYSTALDRDEYTTSPQYPRILDLSLEKRKERDQEAIWEELKRVKTVEEKQIKLNMPKYYGFRSYLLREDHIPYSSLNLSRHVTRTHLIQSEKLPAIYESQGVDDNLLKSIQSEIEDAILFELDRLKRSNNSEANSNDLTTVVTKQINRVLINNLLSLRPHLKDTYIDYDSRIETCWYAGGMKPPKLTKLAKLGQDFMKDKADDPIDRLMYYTGGASLSLRSDKPLKPLLTLDESENRDFNFPIVDYDPRSVGIASVHKHMANVPGFWPGDSKRFGLLSMHRKTEVTSMNAPSDASEEALLRQGILASFAWLSAQANLLGFNTFNDLTYPLVSQTVITDGKKFTFFTYQLNTLVNHSKYVHENPRKNICWAIPEQTLYESVSNSKLVGFNSEVLKNLIGFYANAPEERLGVDLTPFLSQQEKLVADYDNDDKREWLEREYKFLVSNRPRKHLPYEIYAWEKIYKIDHKSRFMDKKSRPFELGQKPYNRKLNERLPKYIPRAHRPDLPRHKGRFANEYWP